MRLLPSIAIIAALLPVLFSGSASAHRGGLNSEGCHNERATGGYHCHRGTATQAPAPVARVYGSDGGASADASRSRAFRNCDEARAAGAAPVRRGDPGYGPHLDRDNDGVGCEPYRGR